MGASEDLSEDEREALHDLQLGTEHLYRAYGHLLSFHHAVGHAMDRLADAEDELEAADHHSHAAVLRDDILPAGVFGDTWSYELVEAYEDGVLSDVSNFQTVVRSDLAGGKRHVTERDQQQRWRRRAEDWDEREED